MEQLSFDDIEEIIKYYPGSNVISDVITISKKTKKEVIVDGKPSHTKYYKSGKIKMLSWGFWLGKRENNLPSSEYYYENGNYQLQEWHNEHGTLIHSIYYFPSGNIRNEMFPEENEVNITKPSLTVYEEKPCYHIKKKRWNHMSFKKPRDELPTCMFYNHLGYLTKTTYRSGNALGKPTTTVYSEFTGNKLCEEWETYSPSGKRMLHRELKDGPARIFYYQNGEKLKEEYFLNDNLIAQYAY